MVDQPEERNELKFANFAVCYVDLLGQRDALKGQGLLPHNADDPEVRQRLIQVVKTSVGSIVKLHEQSAAFSEGATAPTHLRDALPADKHELFDRLRRSNVKTQRWSDGLMLYAAFGDPTVECPINNVFQLVVQAGALCIIGLASKTPLRGAIEMAWATELHPNELYGAAVARGYELEKYTAGHPRIVLGPNILQYLDEGSRLAAVDDASRYELEMAKTILSYLTVDDDGNRIVHYLGKNFANAVFGSNWKSLYEQARTYVEEQLEIHKTDKNSKLSFRYAILNHYFEMHRPS